ncbi:hypothetical protein BDZ45DRAFT_743532 [Acephala macrosclerotiorum]|nr:hypothetical protein BDZ45DRAFT_743532 [Acephala macrosclerotiorum]
MVRLKNRYLLVNILYPELEKNQLKSDIPDVVVFHQPTTNELNSHALLRGIRAEVSSLFGDYGTGALSESLNVKYLSPATSTFILRVSRAHYKVAWAALSMMNSVPKGRRGGNSASTRNDSESTARFRRPRKIHTGRDVWRREERFFTGHSHGGQGGLGERRRRCGQ